MSNRGMKGKQKKWEDSVFSPEVNEVITNNFNILETFYIRNKIYDTDFRDFLMDRFLIACKRFCEVKDIYSIKDFLSACLENSHSHYWPNKIRNNRTGEKIYTDLTAEEKNIYDIAEAYFSIKENKDLTPQEIFAHQFICNLKPKHQKVIYYRFYYPVSGLPSGLSWQGVASEMGTSANSVKLMFATIKKLAEEEVFIDLGEDGYGSKIMNIMTRKIRDKNARKNLNDIFKEIE